MGLSHRDHKYHPTHSHHPPLHSTVGTMHRCEEGPWGEAVVLCALFSCEQTIKTFIPVTVSLLKGESIARKHSHVLYLLLRKDLFLQLGM